jgi:hypothetical protein
MLPGIACQRTPVASRVAADQEQVGAQRLDLGGGGCPVLVQGGFEAVRPGRADMDVRHVDELPGGVGVRHGRTGGSALVGVLLVDGLDVREVVLVLGARSAQDADDAPDEEDGYETDRQYHVDPASGGHGRDSSLLALASRRAQFLPAMFTRMSENTVMIAINPTLSRAT